MRRLYFFGLLFILFGCTYNNEKPGGNSFKNDDAHFDAFKSLYIENLWKTFPDWASGKGNHKYDGTLSVPTDELRVQEEKFVSAYLDSLKKFDINSLSPKNKIDFYLIGNTLREITWNNTVLKSYQWDPSEYNIAGGVAELLTGSTEKLESRLINIYNRLKSVPAYYAVAKENIKNPTLVHTQLAIEQNLNSLPVLEKDILEAVIQSRFKLVAKGDFEDRIKNAVDAIKDFADWLKNLENTNPHSANLGKKLYEEKFQHEIQSGMTAHELYLRAINRKRELHNKMYATTTSIWSKYMGNLELPRDSLVTIQLMIDKLSLKHVHRDSFQIAIENQLPLLVEFVQNKNLIYIDPQKPLVVRKEPSYMAGVATASISAPGPYDKEANTYYNVGSLTGYTNERAESFLREYNHYILQILNIHEAIPGHYTQLVYSNQAPSLIKSLFPNGAMLEGWAVYTELMMMENGYGNNTPEMWLMYYKWHLRSVCNTILDYSFHVLNMDKEAAMKLLVNEAFQQQAEAEGKWKRVNLTQVQLCSYFSGFTEIYDLREELKHKAGDTFNLKTFHEKFLSYGSAPVKYIKQLMLEDTSAVMH